MQSDPTDDLAVHLIRDAANRSPNLMLFLIAEAQNLPADPNDARAMVRRHWPDMSEEERDAAFHLASNLLRRIGRDCAENIARLDMLTGSAGRA